MQNRIADLLVRYESIVLPRKKQPKTEAHYIRKILSYPIADECLETIKNSTIVAYRDEMIQRHGPRSAKYHLQILSHMTTVAISEWDVELSANPFKLVPKPSVTKVRDRRLTPEEFDRFMRACSNEFLLTEYVEIAVATTMRGGELRRMIWPEILWAQRQADIEGKTGRRLVPLSSRALAVLKEVHKFTGGHSNRKIFPFSEQQFRDAWDRARKKAGIRDFRPHDLRHEGISRYMSRRDLTLQEVATVSGHRSLNMLWHYTHLQVSPIADKL